MAYGHRDLLEWNDLVVMEMELPPPPGGGEVGWEMTLALSRHL